MISRAETNLFLSSWKLKETIIHLDSIVINKMELESGIPACDTALNVRERFNWSHKEPKQRHFPNLSSAWQQKLPFVFSHARG